MKRALLILGFLCGVLSGSLQAQTSVMRTFAEAGGSVSTGAGGCIATLGNGDVIVINERWTNFSQKGIQCFRLEKGSLKIIQSKAYFNDFTVQNLRIQVKDDKIYLIAQHKNGSTYKILFMVFDQQLNLLSSVIHQSPESLFVYSFWMDTDGSFRVFGAVTQPDNTIYRCVLSINSNGGIIWSKLFGKNTSFWGGSVLLPDGTIVASLGGTISGTSRGKSIALNRNGDLLWAKGFGNEFVYSVNSGSLDGNAVITRSAYDSSLIYSILLGKDGKYKGQTQGVRMNEPVFSAVLPNKHILVGSSSWAAERVFLKISEWDEKGLLVTNHRIDNIFGYAPTGAIYDACRYATHVDGAGNFYVLGVANRQGFFVLRLNQDMEFDCALKEGGSEPSPVPEQNPESDLVEDMPINFIPYPFIEETAGNYIQVCTGCGSKIQEVLFDGSLCLPKLSHTLDAGNDGAKYLWNDGSTGQQMTIQESGTYWVRIHNACDTLVDTVHVTMNVKPEISIRHSPEFPIPGETITLTGSPDTFTVMNWYYSDSLMGKGEEHNWKGDRNGRYTWYWEVYDDSTCRTLDSLNIKVSLIDYYFPDAFSPNRDDVNDTWGPVGTGIQSYKTLIYNRWGQLVFSGKDALWDGKFEGVGVMDGRYTYLIELFDDDGVRKEYKGMITVVH